jgi:hypothetical protein
MLSVCEVVCDCLDAEARGERVVRIEEILRNPGDPGAPGDGRHNGREIAN